MRHSVLHLSRSTFGDSSQVLLLPWKTLVYELLLRLVGETTMHAINRRLGSVIGQALVTSLQVLAVAVVLSTAEPIQGQAPNPDSTSEAKPRHWHKYLNTTLGFSIWYPDPYRRVPLPPRDAGDLYRTWDKRLLLLQRTDDPNAKIWITLDTRPFNLSTISYFHSPTGWDPDWTPGGPTIGHHIFYFYGAGGGGVDYPDAYFTNLRGKILDIYFDGPYEGKSPGGETPNLEHKMLGTFRVLEAGR